jgi:hypothetical protein
MDKAVVAVAHPLLVLINHVLRDQHPDTAWGAESFDRLDTVRIERHQVRRREPLGYTVPLTPSSA